MYKQMIPAEALAREAQVRETAQQANQCVSRNNDGSDEPASVQAELAKERERYVRLAADFENFKKRTAHESEVRASAKRDALVRELLPILDNLDRALSGSAAGSTEQLREGVGLTLQQFIGLLRRHGFERREDLGRTFDPNFHDAAMTRKDPSLAHHSIVEVWNRGWLFGGKPFRPAKVVVNVLRTDTLPNENLTTNERE